MENVLALMYVVGFVRDFREYGVVNLGMDLVVLVCRKSNRNQHHAYL